MTDNPLLAPWTTPFGVPPFDLIRAEHFPDAFEAGMAAHAAEVQAIAAATTPPSFRNTVEALERSGRVLDRVKSVFFNLVSSQATEALQAVERDFAPKLARHRSEVVLNPGLFARVTAVLSRRAELDLDPDQDRLLVRLHAGLLRAGAGLNQAGRARMTEIAARLATLHTQFGQNVLQDETAWQMELAESELAGLPGFARDAAREAARERGVDGWVITLSRSSVEPFLTFSTDRALRRRAWEAWVARGTGPARDNAPLVKEILALRRERARLLGFADFADWRLADNMARQPAAAEALLREVWAPARRRAEAERAELEALAGHPIEAWDWRHYAERARRDRHAVDETLTKPYFPLEGMLRAIFDTAGRLFGVRFVERTDIPLYHPDVRAFDMQDGEGAHCGLFLLDSFARPAKRSGAWMSSYRVAETLDGPVTPIVVNNNNIAKSDPALLSFDEARTLFHEFGHALHGLLSTARYPSQSGTAVLADFVEFPSQVLEHWLEVPAILRAHARHHESGEPLPEDLLARILAARQAGQGFATVEFVSSALIDLALHTHPDPQSLDLAAFETAFLAEIGMPEAIGLRHRPPHFQHLFAGGGYAAGYYAYMWAEVLDADAFEAFEEAGDPFDPALAARLKAVFEAGDTQDPMGLYVAFRGREPQVGALLRNRGLVGA
ncbi:M3 family metallopeptidase [Falsiroseomonas selenitidurans]|uniref:M3 family metallopeptidase n=1 Tax=Falsiroseomonas selenitidurans TaxID=2716335 RepID=A0ABX1ECF8_9PROT|nr:M3 family metallopeptidase [Falsiroseomonas selenitidurans]NKC32575.1 M3 family metallopeptidase [Falsiroseomonas selenitidurans]